MNIPTNRQCLTPLPSNLGLCVDGCVSFINDFRFQEHIFVYQDERKIQLTQSILARSLVSSHDLLSVAHVLQVSIFVGAQFCMLALIANIVDLAGWELLRWLHWKADFT